MHQVLSYEAAVRANNTPEYREYVTKRTCISLIVTIAFFTLVSGYLLGNFVSERKNHIRLLLTKKIIHNGDDDDDDDGINDADKRLINLSNDDYGKLQELHSYQRTKDKLLTSAEILMKMLQQDENYHSTSLNTEIFNKYISCTQDVPPNTNIDSNQFIEQLIDNTMARQKDCLRIIQLIINNNLATG